MPRSISRACVVLALLIFLLPLSPRPTASAPEGPHLMPPHPSLWEKIARGEISLPAFLSDPEWARAMGIEQPNDQVKGLKGPINALAVVVDFSDKVKTVTASYFDTLIFAAPVAGRGSVNDYYNEVSYGAITIVTVNLPSSLGWQRAPQTYSYYVGGNNCTHAPYPNNCQKLAEDIVDAVNGVVNFANYDNDSDGYAEPIMLIHAGPGAEFTVSVNDVWSHSWSLKYPRSYDGVTINRYVIMPEYWMNVSASTSDMTIGVFAHEMGHGFWGLPDLYDRDYSSKGIGNWSLMAGGSWNGPNSGGWGSDGSSPAWLDAWTRIQAGFASATSVSSDGVVTVTQAYSNPAPVQTVFKLHTSRLASQEYFLLENREQVPGSYDEYLPGQGLFIWHTDEAMWNYTLQNDYECTLDRHCNCSDSQHFLVALEQADGLRDLEYGNDRGDNGDPFPGSSNNRNWTRVTHPESGSWYSCLDSCIAVKNISNAGASMTAELQVTCGAAFHYVYLPLVFSHHAPGWQTLVNETFEGDFPGPWTVFDNDGSSNGEYYWSKRDCRHYAGSYSGWAVGGGSNGSALPCGSVYPGGADSWMVYGPFSLADASDADLTYKLWLKTESGADGVCRFASIDGNNFYGWCTSGDSGGWIDRELDLTNVPTLGNLLGQSQVWVALVFASDGSMIRPEGGYVDNVLLRKYVSGLQAATEPAPAPALPEQSQDRPASMHLPGPVYERGN